MKSTFTTFEAAKHCGVFHTTVINWVNKGKLRARTTPGGHRRIAAEDLLDFMKIYKMPIPRELQNAGRRFVVVEEDQGLAKLLDNALQRGHESAEISTCRDGAEALIRIGAKVPDVVILDLNLPAVDGFKVCKALKSDAATKGVKIIGMSDRPITKAQRAFLQRHTDAFFQKPLSIEKIAAQAAKLAAK